MNSIENLNISEQEIELTKKTKELKQKFNADSWNDNSELLMKQWGEKAAGLRFMHSTAARGWTTFSNRLSVTGIIITSIASGLSLIAAGVENNNLKDNILFSVGGIGLISTFIQSLKKFYNSEEKAAEHFTISKQFGSFYRYMTLQLGMTRDERDPANILVTWVLKEYERLQQEAPPLDDKSIKIFKKKFQNPDQSMPDVAADEFIINVKSNTNIIKVNEVEKISTTNQ